MKYRKKPIIVEAVQWFPHVMVDGVEQNWDNDPRTPNDWTIDTLEGRLHVLPGDWIITGILGERYPCNPKIFEMTYEKVEE